jgi:PAS domain S-box-containing protein
MSSVQQVDFQLLFESTPGLYLILSPDFQITAVSDAYLQATMTTRPQILGKNLFEIFPDNPDDPVATGEKNLRASLNYVLEQKTAHTMAIQKYDIRTPDGSFEERFWSPLNKPILDESQNVKYIIHRVEDVTAFVRMKEQEARQIKATQQLQDLANTQEQEIYARAQEIQNINKKLIEEIAERKNAETRAKLTHLLLESCINSFKDVLIFSIDTHYNYLNCNNNFKLATLQAYGTIVCEGSNLLDCITDPNDRERAKANCDRALSGESHVTIEEYGDANRFYFETHYDPIRNENNEITGVTVLSSNITDRKQAELHIEALNQELEAFSYSVAHDLRAPLRIIDGYSDILQEEYFNNIDDEARRLIGVVKSNTRQMGQLIDDLLNFSRLGRLPIQRKHSNLNDMLDSVIREQLTMVLRERIEFRIDPLEPCHCDDNLMKHVLSNLVSNAIKYSRNKERAIIEVGSEKRQSETVYFIRDNGSGFDMQYAGKLFGVFQRLHKPTEFEGTGVGLAIVQRVIDKHGGRVWAEGEVNKGATFYFSLPL